MIQCEGYRRAAGFFTLGGDPRWVRCTEAAIAIIEVEQEKVEKLPACQDCWDECKARRIKIHSAEPLIDPKHLIYDPTLPEEFTR